MAIRVSGLGFKVSGLDAGDSWSGMGDDLGQSWNSSRQLYVELSCILWLIISTADLPFCLSRQKFHATQTASSNK